MKWLQAGDLVMPQVISILDAPCISVRHPSVLITLHMPQVTTYPLADVRKAHAAIESGRTVGKLVLLSP